MGLYVVTFSDRLAEAAAAMRDELRKWGATLLWNDVWIVEMPGRPQDCLPGFAASEAAISVPLFGSVPSFSIGRAAGLDVQLLHAARIEPEIMAAEAIAPNAVVRYFNGGEQHFAPAVEHYDRLRAERIYPTELCQLMAAYGSDKGLGWHGYTLFYTTLLGPYRETVTSLCEVGLGTPFGDVPSNMGEHGAPGASLRAWRDFFSNADIIGADVDRRILFVEDRIRTFFVDQNDPATFDSLWSQLSNSLFDIFVDDGLHTFEAACTTFEHSVKKLKPGGIYIVEDVLVDQIDRYIDFFSRQGYAGLSIRMPHLLNTYDNSLMVVHIDGSTVSP